MVEGEEEEEDAVEEDDEIEDDEATVEEEDEGEKPDTKLTADVSFTSANGIIRDKKENSGSPYASYLCYVALE